MIYILFLAKLTWATFLGGVIGWQRERIGKFAGPRTYGLVCVGAALFTILSIEAFGVAEAGRVAAQIITGIGFLGAGMIIHKGADVLGLTTAAGMWACAAIGMAVGVGWFVQSLFAAVLVFLILSFNDSKLIKRK